MDPLIPHPPQSIRLIGDVHGDFTPIRLAVSHGLTVVQMGDLGFRKEWQKITRLRDVYVLRGNHDDPEAAVETANDLGDFGDLGDRIPGTEGTFFVRGAWSIDRDMRIEGRDWWRDEELSPDRMEEALAAYEVLRPDTVLTHECPLTIAKAYVYTAYSNRTNLLLERMFDIHKPTRWFHAHWHFSREMQVFGTTFRCLGICEALDVEFGSRSQVGSSRGE